MNRKNQLISVFFVLFGVFILVMLPKGIPFSGSVSAKQMSPKSYPTFIAWFMIVCGVIQFILSTVSIVLGTEIEEWEKREVKREAKVLLIFVLILLYIWGSGVIGFFLASAIFVCAFLAILQVKKWWYYLTAVALSFAAFYCFRYLLYVRLPTLGAWII